MHSEHSGQGRAGRSIVGELNQVGGFSVLTIQNGRPLLEWNSGQMPLVGSGLFFGLA